MDKFLLLFVIALCGIRASCLKAEGANRILEGSPANENQLRYMVSLQKISELHNDTRGHKCGGALVTLQHAVTAASCNFEQVNGASVAINPVAYRVFSGALLLTNDGTTYNFRLITNITVHPQYYPSSPLVNDIAVIFLNSAFSSITNTPVPLSMWDANVTDLAPCVVSGWGAQNATATASIQLMQLQQRVFDQTACRAVYTSLPIGQLNIIDSMICAWNAQQPFAGCTGDDGNPLVCNGNLNGILIRSKNCTVSTQPEVYTRISSHKTWIDSITGMGSPSGASTFQPGVVVLAVIAIAQVITVNVIN